MNFKDSALVNYQFKYLTMNESELVYKKKKKKDKEEKKEGNEIIDLNKIDINNNDDKGQIQEFKKYSFPVKKFKDEDKTINSREVISRMMRDKEIFSDFLYRFLMKQFLLLAINSAKLWELIISKILKISSLL